jgi:hypothetical protein
LTAAFHRAGHVAATRRIPFQWPPLVPKAEPLFRRALAITEKSYGPDHPDVAIDLNNLAELLRDTNRLSEAGPLYGRALAIYVKNFGPDYPGTKKILENLLLLQDGK